MCESATRLGSSILYEHQQPRDWKLCLPTTTRTPQCSDSVALDPLDPFDFQDFDSKIFMNFMDFHGFSWFHHLRSSIGILAILAISVRQCPRNTWWASMASNSFTSTAAAVPTAMTVLQVWLAKSVRGRLMEMRLVTVSGSESPGKHLMNYIEHCLQYHIKTGYIRNIICTYLYHPGKNLWWRGEVGSARMDWNFS